MQLYVHLPLSIHLPNRMHALSIGSIGFVAASTVLGDRSIGSPIESFVTYIVLHYTALQCVPCIVWYHRLLGQLSHGLSASLTSTKRCSLVGRT